MKQENKWKAFIHRVNTLFEMNWDSVLTYNHQMLTTLILVSVVMLCIPLITSPFSESKMQLIPVYLILMVMVIVSYLIFLKTNFHEKPTYGIYLFFVIAFIFSIYLSVINSPTQRATILLGMFCVFPLCILDKPYRVILVSFVFFTIHTILAFSLKGYQLGMDDMVNAFCYFILGSILGGNTIKTRLESFDSKRLLMIEQQIDYLTGLHNRRKLFQTIEQIDAAKYVRPTAVAVMDLDDFKLFNDKYGHVSGDEILRAFADVLQSYEVNHSLKFYRYGGEEFVALAWEYNISEVKEIFESIKSDVNAIGGSAINVGVSTGLVPSDIHPMKSFDLYLNLADSALYQAKDLGKNRVIVYGGL